MLGSVETIEYYNEMGQSWILYAIYLNDNYLFCVFISLVSKLDDNKKENKSKAGDKAISHETSGINSYPFAS
jgi:hypothetical protein